MSLETRGVGWGGGVTQRGEAIVLTSQVSSFSTCFLYTPPPAPPPRTLSQALRSRCSKDGLGSEFKDLGQASYLRLPDGLFILHFLPPRARLHVWAFPQFPPHPPPTSHTRRSDVFPSAVKIYGTNGLPPKSRRELFTAHEGVSLTSKSDRAACRRTARLFFCRRLLRTLEPLLPP